MKHPQGEKRGPGSLCKDRSDSCQGKSAGGASHHSDRSLPTREGKDAQPAATSEATPGALTSTLSGARAILMLLSSPCHRAHVFWLLVTKSKCDLILNKPICAGRMQNEIAQHERLQQALPPVTRLCTELRMKSALQH